MTLFFDFDTDSERLRLLADALDIFVLQQQNVAALVETLTCQSDYLYTVPAHWRRMFLSLRRSVTLVTAEAQRCGRDLNEMELRFVLSLCLDMKDMVVAIERERQEPVEVPAALVLAAE
jgi:hypothetical protein